VSERIIYCVTIFIGIGFAAWCAVQAWVTRSRARWIGNEKNDRERLTCCQQSLMMVERVSENEVAARCVVCGKIVMIV
jgi:hypothetical protein